jgi:hypothetical protein
MTGLWLASLFLDVQAQCQAGRVVIQGLGATYRPDNCWEQTRVLQPLSPSGVVTSGEGG